MATPPPYDDITGISRTIMKDNQSETLENYDGNARPGELVVDLSVDPPNVYVGNSAGLLTQLGTGGSGETTSQGTFATLPDFLEFFTPTPLSTGQNNFGIFFSGNAGNEDISYPIRTNFPIPGNTKVVVQIDMEVNDECSDFGLCVFEGDVQPRWAWGPETSRLSAQYNCPTPELNSFDESNSSDWSLPGPGTYRVRFTYDPQNTPNLTLETLDTSDTLLDTITLNGTLNTSNDYFVGFAADQDDEDKRTYVKNLIISIDGGSVYSDSLLLTSSAGLPLSNGTSNIDIPSLNGNVTITANGSYTWNFDDSGNLTTPGNLQISTVGMIPGTSIMQTGATLGVFSSGNSGQLITGWGENVFGPGNVAVMTFNTTPGTINITTGDNNSTTYEWDFDSTGNVYMPGSIIGKTPNNNGSLQWVGNSSGDGFGYTTLNIVPDNSLTSNDQYLIIDPTAPGHIHIRAGGTQDSSMATLFLGGENSYFQVPSGTDPSVYVTAGGNSWQFGNNGQLTTPGPVQLAVYADTIARDTMIPSPAPGMTIYVTGVGMQVYGATQWNTIAGSGT